MFRPSGFLIRRLHHWKLNAFSTQFKFRMMTPDDKVFQCLGVEGETLMQAGIRAGVQFEVACGGNAECCTCHCKLTDSVMQSSDYIEPEEKEIDALDWAEGVDSQSRLACQTKLSKAFEGADIKFIGA